MKPVAIGAALGLALALTGAGRCELGVSAPDLPQRAAVIVLKVADFEAAREQVAGALSAGGGLLLDSRTDVTDKGRQHGWLRFRVKSDIVAATLADIKEFGKLYSEKVTTTEARPEADELTWRLAQLREHQRRLDGLLNGNRRLRGSDTLFIQERRFRAGIDEGIARRQMGELKRAVGTCTLQVELFEPGATPLVEQGRVHLVNWFAASLGRAVTALNHAAARAATLTAYAVVFSPVWLLLGLAGYVAWRRHPIVLRLPHRPAASSG